MQSPAAQGPKSRTCARQVSLGTGDVSFSPGARACSCAWGLPRVDSRPCGSVDGTSQKVCCSGDVCRPFSVDPVCCFYVPLCLSLYPGFGFFSPLCASSWHHYHICLSALASTRACAHLTLIPQSGVLGELPPRGVLGVPLHAASCTLGNAV